MIESSTPPLAVLDDYRNVTDLLIARATAAPDHIAFEVEGRVEVAGADAGASASWRPVTTRAFSDQVRALAKGFIAQGIQPGDPIAIMAPTRYEWAVADLASWFAGAVVVPIYETSSPSQVNAIVADAGVRLAIAGTVQHATLLRDALAAAPEETLGAWTMDTAASGTLSDLVALGVDVTDDELEARGLRRPRTTPRRSSTPPAPRVSPRVSCSRIGTSSARC